MIALLEGQIQNLGLAENHPRWTNTGEIGMIGDMGRFGYPDTEIRQEGRIVGIDGLKAVVWMQPIDPVFSDHYAPVPFGQMAELVGRSRLPRNV